MFFQKEREKAVQGHRIRHHAQFTPHAPQIRIFPSYQFEQIFDMHPAFHFIQVVSLHQRKPGVAGFPGKLPVFLKGSRQIHHIHFRARGHYVLDAHIVQFKGIFGNFSLLLRQLAGTFAFFHQIHQFIRAVHRARRGTGVYAQQVFQHKPRHSARQAKNTRISEHRIKEIQ